MFRGITKGEWIIGASLISCCVILLVGTQFFQQQNPDATYSSKQPIPVQPQLDEETDDSGDSNPDPSDESVEAIEPSGFTDGILDLNLATLKDLESLPNIGPKKAQVILDFREHLGGFATIEELDLVSGIGEKTLQSLRPLITITSPRTTPLPSSQLESNRQPEPEIIIHLNTATFEQLMELKGIGEVTARKIMLDRRLNGPYRTIHDLQRVKGIGPATVQNNAHRLRL